MYSKEDILQCLKFRKKWYEDAIRVWSHREDDMSTFDFPEGDTYAWKGAVRELQNTIDMLEVK